MRREAGLLLATDAEIGGRPLSALSVRDLQRAIAAEKGRRPAEAKRVASQKARVRALAAALRPLGIRASKLTTTARGVCIALDWADVERVAQRSAR